MILSLIFESVSKVPTSCAVLSGYFIYGLYNLFMVNLYKFEEWCYLINDKNHFKMFVAADQTFNVSINSA